MVLEMDSGHEAARRNNPNKLCCGCDRSHHPGMFWEDKGGGNTSSCSSRVRKHRHPKAWRKAVRNKATLPIKYFHLDPPVLAPFQSFLVMFPEIMLRFRSTLPIINECSPLPRFLVTALGLKKSYFSDRGWHVCIFIKRASCNPMEFTLHKEIIFCNYQNLKHGYKPALEVQHFCFRNTGKTKTHTPGRTADGNLSSKETSNSIITWTKFGSHLWWTRPDPKFSWWTRPDPKFPYKLSTDF